MRYPFDTLDVFTTERFGGNPLAVVRQAEGIDEGLLQTIAREFNLSETTFVVPPSDPANTAAVRIFTPGAELPFAGHPTIGTAIVLAEELEGDADTSQRTIRFEERIGLVEVRVRKQAGEAAFAELSAAVIPERNRDAPGVREIAAALSLSEADIAEARHVPGDHIAGNAFLFVPVRDLDAVARAHVDRAAWTALASGKGWVGAFVYAPGGESPDASFRARMFGPDVGIEEDPATGSAAAIFPGQIHDCENLSDGTHEWLVEQGYDMGRPSRIFVEADVAGGALQSIRVGGHAVRVSCGQISI